MPEYSTPACASSSPCPKAWGEVINGQGGLYHVVLRGMTKGKPFESIERIECVRDCLNPFTQWEEVEEAACTPELRFVFSNTTEAGIEYRPGVDTFPSKVARLLAARRRRKLPGLIFLPCELIEHNGESLRECVLRYLADDAETSPRALQKIYTGVYYDIGRIFAPRSCSRGDLPT